MDRSIKTGSLIAPRIALAVTTAIAGLTLGGYVATAAPRAESSFENAQEALAKGKIEKAIKHGEAAVLAAPRNPAYRALLGAAYLESGRFESAAATFGDAMDLGDTNPRTVLSFALAKIGSGDSKAALAVLDQHASDLDPADLGLALALAGQPERGVHVLVNAVRSAEESTPKLRQNLAYSYALAGNWRAARVMAAEDVPADQVEARIAQWAQMSSPEMAKARIASLLDVAPRADAGQPERLALANFPEQPVMMAAAEPQAESDFAQADAPLEVTSVAPSSAFTAAFAAAEPSVETVQPVAEAPVRFVSNPVVQQLPASSGARRAPAAPAAPRVAQAASQRRMAATATAAPAAAKPAAAAAAPVPSDKGPSTHLVQLGAFSSKAEATRGWATLQAKFPQLKGRQPVITEAVVNGKTFWRVAAAGFGAQSAKAMCGTVKSAGRGCFAYAASSPPAGAVKRDVQMASRSR